DPDRKRDEGFDLLVLEILFEITVELPRMGLDHLAAAAARAPFLPHRIILEDALLDVARVGGERLEAGCGPVRLAGLAQPAVLELMDLVEIDARDIEALADLRHDRVDMLAPIARGAKSHRRVGD